MKVEGIKIKYKTENDEVKAYLAKPKEEGSYPGVALIHEIFGVEIFIAYSDFSAIAKRQYLYAKNSKQRYGF